jgi:hypothetical protein
LVTFSPTYLDSILVLVTLYPLVVEALLIEFHNSIVPLTIMINPGPPRAIPEGMLVICEITYGKTATAARNGPPIQLTRFKTLVMCFSVSKPLFIPGINFPDFSKFSDSCCGFSWTYE